MKRRFARKNRSLITGLSLALLISVAYASTGSATLVAAGTAEAYDSGAQCGDAEDEGLQFDVSCTQRNGSASARGSASYYKLRAAARAQGTATTPRTGGEGIALVTFFDSVTITSASLSGTARLIPIFEFDGVSQASGSGGVSVDAYLELNSAFGRQRIVDINDPRSPEFGRFVWNEAFGLRGWLRVLAVAGGSRFSIRDPSEPGTASGDYFNTFSIVGVTVQDARGREIDPSLYTISTTSGVPIPEPSTALLFCAGLVGLALQGRGTVRGNA